MSDIIQSKMEKNPPSASQEIAQIRALRKTSKVYFRTVYRLLESYRLKHPDPEQDLDSIRYTLRSWSQDLLDAMGTDVEVWGKPEESPPRIFVGNHVSYLDIPLFLAHVQAIFVTKHQINYWPFFGQGCRRSGMIMVKREKTNSRRAAIEGIKHSLTKRGMSVCIFPSGTTSLGEEKQWRAGAFAVSKELGIPIQPFRIRYQPLREVAYIGRDFFPTHLWQLAKRPQIQASLEFHEPVEVRDPEADSKRWSHWACLGDSAPRP